MWDYNPVDMPLPYMYCEQPPPMEYPFPSAPADECLLQQLYVSQLLQQQLTPVDIDWAAPVFNLNKPRRPPAPPAYPGHLEYLWGFQDIWGLRDV